MIIRCNKSLVVDTNHVFAYRVVLGSDDNTFDFSLVAYCAESNKKVTIMSSDCEKDLEELLADIGSMTGFSRTSFDVEAWWKKHHHLEVE